MKYLEYDLFVIGAGSGGVRASRLAASRGLKVGLAENWSVGGTCVNRGCIPKKLYSYASHFKNELKLMRFFGWKAENISFNWRKLVSQKKKEIRRLNDIYENLLKSSGVKIHYAKAMFLDDKTLKLSNNTFIKSKYFLIAVGGKPNIPDIIGNEFAITSDQAFDLKMLPKKILIIGGGYIAVEFASIFNGLGVKTAICLRGKEILRGFDKDCTDFLTNQMKKKGIDFFLNCKIEKIEKFKGNLSINLLNKQHTFDTVMFATGRQSNTGSIGIHKTNIKLNSNNSIKVNKFYQTSVKNIFAIGDVIDKVQLTPVAISEAKVLIGNLGNKKKSILNYKNIPTAIFSDPNMATVGLSEVEAIAKYKKIEVFTTQFKPLKYTTSNFEDKVFIKLVVEKKSQRVLGLHYIGDDAAEIIQGFSVAVVKGLKKADFEKTIGIHPSSAEEIVTI